MSAQATLRLGTRGSGLAVAQSGIVAAALQEAVGRPVELVIIRTRGDQIRDRPLSEVGGKGLFTKEIEEALLNGDVDLAVHSMKDLPTENPAGLVVAAVPERVDPRDALVGGTLETLREHARVGTGSERRARQLALLRPDLEIVGIRGNVDTRIGKVGSEVDAVVLAEAGLQRLGRTEVREILSIEQMLPSVGQGALAVQCRAESRALMSVLDHPPTAAVLRAERAFLTEIAGGCSVPAACHARLVDGELVVRGWYFEGTHRRATLKGPSADAARLGGEVARAVRGG